MIYTQKVMPLFQYEYLNSSYSTSRGLIEDSIIISTISILFCIMTIEIARIPNSITHFRENNLMTVIMSNMHGLTSN